MTPYEKGRRFEATTRKDLETNGYRVMRASGSKGSTKADLAGFKPGQLLLVQCKEDGQITSGEWDTLVETAGWVGAIPLLAFKGGRGEGVQYVRLLGPKQRGQQRTDSEPFLLDEVIA